MLLNDKELKEAFERGLEKNRLTKIPEEMHDELYKIFCMRYKEDAQEYLEETFRKRVYGGEQQSKII